ncbi:MAG: HDOD domain-containing protein [Proteobacteria bacterium]|nr:HDOD domain-containing protein [Pseudomonadota bacterium]
MNRGLQPTAAEPRALQARRDVAEIFTQKLAPLPPAPLDFSAIANWAPLPGRAELESLRDTAFSAAREYPQLRTLWRETVATALCSDRAARAIHADAAAVTAAALLHRVGESLTLAALLRSEAETGVILDAPSRATLVAHHAAEVAERVMRWWCIPAPIAAAALGWRRFGEFPTGPKNSAALYLGHLLAIEWLQPQICAPGIVASVAAEFGLEPATIAAARPDAELKTRLARLPGIAVHEPPWESQAG